MFLNRELLKNELEGLVGMHQTENPEYPLLVNSLTESRSNRFVQDAQPGLLTIENIDQSAKNFDHFNYPAYDTATRDAGGYQSGSKVAFNNLFWEYIAAVVSDNTTPDPGTDPNVWRQINSLSDYLSRIYRQAVDETLDGWINTKKMREKIKSISENIQLYDGIANRRDVVVNSDKFVGIRLRFIDERSITAVINSIGTQFTSPVIDLPILVFHSSQFDALGQLLVSSPGISSKWTPWTDQDTKTLRYLDYDRFVGGEFYIGYRQSDLQAQGAQALRKDIVWRQGPSGCKSCNRKWSRWFEAYSRYMDITGFEIAETDMPGTPNFNPENTPYTLGTNYGLNMNLSIKCDLTRFVIQEQDILAESIQLTWAKKILEGIASTTRQGNEIANVIKEQARRELFEHNEAFGTVADRMIKAYKAIEFDFSDLHEDCMPCDYEGDDAMAGTYTFY